MAYHKAPYFYVVYPIIEKILKYDSENLSDYIINSIKVIAEYLSITSEIIVSSTMKKNNELKGEDKVIEICKLLNATEYYNAIGGIDLYSFENFRKNKIKLIFLKTNDIIYKQFNDNFIKNLSIIDVMMFNSRENLIKLLNDYSLIYEKSE